VTEAPLVESSRAGSPETDSPQTPLREIVDPAHEQIAAALQGLDSSTAGSRDYQLACDAALAAVCQHLIGVEVVLAPLACRRLPDGRARVAPSMRSTRRLEAAIRLLEQRLWGDSQAPHLPLEVLHARLRPLLEEHQQAEAELLTALEEVLDPAEREGLAARLDEATRRAPTRPHAHAWRSSTLSRLYYRIAGAWDRTLDVMDCRTLPRARQPKAAPGLWGSYLMGTGLRAPVEGTPVEGGERPSAGSGPPS
jgi:hypothetical protein